MTPERWRQIEELYHSAREREPGQRSALLEEACRGDEELRRKVELLLAQDPSGKMLDRPAALAADAVRTVDPRFDSVSADPRFKALQERLGLVEP